MIIVVRLSTEVALVKVTHVLVIVLGSTFAAVAIVSDRC